MNVEEARIITKQFGILLQVRKNEIIPLSKLPCSKNELKEAFLVEFNALPEDGRRLGYDIFLSAFVFIAHCLPDEDAELLNRSHHQMVNNIRKPSYNFSEEESQRYEKVSNEIPVEMEKLIQEFKEQCASNTPPLSEERGQKESSIKFGYTFSFEQLKWIILILALQFIPFAIISNYFYFTGDFEQSSFFLGIACFFPALTIIVGFPLILVDTALHRKGKLLILLRNLLALIVLFLAGVGVYIFRWGYEQLSEERPVITLISLSCLYILGLFWFRSKKTSNT